MIIDIRRILLTPSYTLLLLALISAAALGMALTSQYVFGLQPCELCYYQRVPFLIVIALGIYGWLRCRTPNFQGKLLLALAAMAFLLNSVIAFYHSGVERKWWPSFLEGCAVPKMEGNITDVLAKIAETPVVRCDEIPWTDPVLSLSMANYNVLFSLALCVLALYALKKSNTNI